MKLKILNRLTREVEHEFTADEIMCNGKFWLLISNDPDCHEKRIHMDVYNYLYKLEA